MSEGKENSEQPNENKNCAYCPATPNDTGSRMFESLASTVNGELCGIEKSQVNWTPVELGYDHFPCIGEMERVADVQFIETEECFDCWLARANREKEVLYRGQRDASRLMTSTLLRCANKHKRDYKACEDNFAKKLKDIKRQHDLGNEQQAVAYSQHYFEISPFIDLTHDPYTALWFATKSNEPKYSDSALKDYFSIIQIRKTIALADIDDSIKKSLDRLLESKGDYAEKYNVVKECIMESAIKTGKEIATPMLICPSRLHDINNARMSAQAGAFLYLGKFACYPFESVVSALKCHPNGPVKMNYILISRKLFNYVREALAVNKVCEKSLFPDKHIQSNCIGCVMKNNPCNGI